MADKIWVGTTDDLNTASNWSPSGVPTAGDNVYIPAGSGAIGSNMAALKTATIGGALGTVEIQDGYSSAIGSRSAYMQFTCSTFRCGGTNTMYVDLEASAISFELRGTGTLYLKGSALATVSVVAGTVGLAAYGSETSTVTTLRVIGNGATVTAGTGLTVTTIQVVAGNVTAKCGGTTLDLQNGNVTTLGSGTWTTATVDQGTLVANSSGTITTLNLNGGTADFLQGGLPRTVSTLVHSGGVLRYDSGVLTITTYTKKTGPAQLVASDP